MDEQPNRPATRRPTSSTATTGTGRAPRTRTSAVGAAAATRSRAAATPATATMPPPTTEPEEGPAPTDAAPDGGTAADTTAAKAAPARARRVGRPASPATLSIDIGGTGLKASVLDAEGKMLADRVRVVTKYPLPPDGMVDLLAALVAPLPSFDRISAGFPGVVRGGLVLTAPHFVTEKGPGTKVSGRLLKAWTNFDLAGALETRLGKPVRLANDADLQGLDVVKGKGLELVVTLGTGVGTGVFLDGKLAPHLELAHHPFRKDQNYNEQLGDAALKRIGAAKWRKRVREAIANFEVLLNYDHLYLGGGNSKLMSGHVPRSVTIVDNVAGILGGIKLWGD